MTRKRLHNRRLVSTAGVRAEERRWKGGWGEKPFVGVNVMPLWGMCLQGAKGPQSGGTGAEGGQDLLLLQKGRGELEGGTKTEPETNPSLPLPPVSHTDKLPQIPFTKSPAYCSQSPERHLTTPRVLVPALCIAAVTDTVKPVLTCLRQSNHCLQAKKVCYFSSSESLSSWTEECVI